MSEWKWTSGRPLFEEEIYWDRRVLLVDGELAATVDEVSCFDSYVIVDSCDDSDPIEADLPMSMEKAMKWAESMARMKGWK